MGLNPSCNLDEGLKGFPVLGDPPFRTSLKAKAVQELIDVGLPRGSTTVTTKEVEVYQEDSKAAKLARAGISIPSANAESATEWIEVHKVEGKAFGWTFFRAWYYWVCEAKDSKTVLPKTVAEKLNAEHFCDVRVGGFAGGQNVTGPVGSYHVDTPVGLAALVAVLKQRHEEREAKRDREFKEKYGCKRRP
jgi:hypothetical protein